VTSEFLDLSHHIHTSLSVKLINFSTTPCTVKLILHQLCTFHLVSYSRYVLSHISLSIILHQLCTFHLVSYSRYVLSHISLSIILHQLCTFHLVSYSRYVLSQISLSIILHQLCIIPYSHAHLLKKISPNDFACNIAQK
jgi:hypothetical protein